MPHRKVVVLEVLQLFKPLLVLLRGLGHVLDDAVQDDLHVVDLRLEVLDGGGEEGHGLACLLKAHSLGFDLVLALHAGVLHLLPLALKGVHHLHEVVDLRVHLNARFAVLQLHRHPARLPNLPLLLLCERLLLPVTPHLVKFALRLHLLLHAVRLLDRLLQVRQRANVLAIGASLDWPVTTTAHRGSAAIISIADGGPASIVPGDGGQATLFSACGRWPATILAGAHGWPPAIHGGASPTAGGVDLADAQDLAVGRSDGACLDGALLDANDLLSGAVRLRADEHFGGLDGGGSSGSSTP
mmetsp:Transcript_4699/g.16539  ORF Transcript_4699/g.16539 Transcript_4699/m.16539 type:complete len:299 (-) Transcript_4699:619-1515(-)